MKISKNKFGYKLVALITTSLISINASAGGYLGYVGRVTVQQPNYVFVDLGGINGGAGCQGGSNEFAIDISTILGQAQYTLLMTAKGLGKKVQIIGTNSCSLWPDRESVNYMFFE